MVRLEWREHTTSSREKARWAGSNGEGWGDQAWMSAASAGLRACCRLLSGFYELSHESTNVTRGRQKSGRVRIGCRAGHAETRVGGERLCSGRGQSHTVTLSSVCHLYERMVETR